jgi:hypothetical protein
VLTDARLGELAAALMTIGGVEAVALGGSRARGTHRPDSDVDLGLYYRPPLDVDGLRVLAAALADGRDGRAPQLTEPGAWGPWVDGGGWLLIDGMAVDWIYRDLDRVRASCVAAQQGAAQFHAQVGHPLGVPDFAYAGEVALGQVLADPDGELAALRRQVAPYPAALADALIGGLTEAEFLLGGLGKPAARGDVAFVAGALFRVIGLCAHALHARAGCWVITEKGLVDVTGTLASAPANFSRRSHALLGRLGATPDELRASTASAGALLSEVVAVCAGPPPPG